MKGLTVLARAQWLRVRIVLDVGRLYMRHESAVCRSIRAPSALRAATSSLELPVCSDARRRTTGSWANMASPTQSCLRPELAAMAEEDGFVMGP